MIIVLGAIFYLWLNNSQEPKIRELIFSGVLVGSILALIGAWSILKEKKIISQFPCAIIVNKDSADRLLSDFQLSFNNKPFTVPYSSVDMNVSPLLQEYKKASPKKFEENDTLQNYASQFYGEIIGYHILELLFRNFHHSWLLDIKQYKTPLGVFTYTTPPSLLEGRRW